MRFFGGLNAIMFFFEKKYIITGILSILLGTRNDLWGFFSLKKTTGGPRLGFGS